MAQPPMTSTSIAREVHWTYWLTSETTMEKTFYVALHEVVADEILRHLAPDASLWVGREMQLRVGNYVVRARVINITPLLANSFDHTTTFRAQYRERAKDEGLDISTFIAEVIRYPNMHLGADYKALVGIDDIKDDIFSKLLFLFKPDLVKDWLDTYYPGNSSPLLRQTLLNRYPLILLSGEVGAGKTALARSIGHHLAVYMNSDLVLYVVNAQVRGGGHVGELTQNISRAFTEAELCHEREQIPVMILIDEADALAQGRGGNQTHHEDDAGVNTLIQRIDRLRGRSIAVIFTTNLAGTIDNAILRRATAHHQFGRPDYWQRAEVFRSLLAPMGFSEHDIDKLAARTNPYKLEDGQYHCYTYSDIVQRIIPQAAEAAMQVKKKLLIGHLINACQDTLPTPELVPKNEASSQYYFKPVTEAQNHKV